MSVLIKVGYFEQLECRERLYCAELAVYIESKNNSILDTYKDHTSKVLGQLLNTYWGVDAEEEQLEGWQGQYKVRRVIVESVLGWGHLELEVNERVERIKRVLSTIVQENQSSIKPRNCFFKLN